MSGVCEGKQMRDLLAYITVSDPIHLALHRSVGGIRTSLYNAITLEETQKLADFVSFPEPLVTDVAPATNL